MGHFKALIPDPTISDGWLYCKQNPVTVQMNNEQTRSTMCHVLTRDPSKAVSSQDSQHQKRHMILYLAITFSQLLVVICLSSVHAFLYWDPKRMTSSPTVRIRFHFLSTFFTLKKTVVFNIIKGISLNTRLKHTSFPFPELSIWSNYVWYTLKGFKSSDPKKHVLLQVCTIQSQGNRCTGATQTPMHTERYLNTKCLPLLHCLEFWKHTELELN